MAPDSVPPDAPRIDLGDGFSLRGANVTATPQATGVRRRGAEAGLDAGDQIESALVLAEMTEVKQVEVTPVDGGGAPGVTPRRRRGGGGAPADTASEGNVVELEAPEPPEGQGQVVMAVDTATGVVTWHMSTRAKTRRGGAATAGRRIYRIPLAPALLDQGPHRRGGRRGLIGAIAKKLLRVLVFPVTDLILGPLEKFIALKWEDAHAPYVCRTFTPENYTSEVRTQLTPDQWKLMSGGRALLFVHGTFSSAHGAFSLLRPDHLRAFHVAYEGRVLAYNHHTVGHDPFENVRRFCEAVTKANAKLDLDIICHSRGGLVSRCLAAADQFGGGGRVKVSRLCFVAAPNYGTLLADAANMSQMLDRYTNFTKFLPDGPIEVAVELVLTAVKALAHAGLKFLPGLAAQAPGSDALGRIAKLDPGGAEFFGLTANFEPTATHWLALSKQVVEDQIMDRVFKEAQNDLVVPTLGVTTASPPLAEAAGFPVAAANQFTFGYDTGVIHTDFFGNATTVSKLMEWLNVAPVAIT